MFIMDVSKDECIYFIFFIYSLGLFCQHISLEGFAHICVFERDFFGGDPVSSTRSVSHFQECFIVLTSWPSSCHLYSKLGCILSLFCSPVLQM